VSEKKTKEVTSKEAAPKAAAKAVETKSVETKAEPAKAEAPAEAKSEAPKNYSRGEGQKPVTQAYKDNWNAIYGKKKK
jgi:hypothetical protein